MADIKDRVREQLRLVLKGLAPSIDDFDDAIDFILAILELAVVDLKAELKPLDNSEITNALSIDEIEIMGKSGYAEVIGRMLTAVVLAQCKKAKDRGFRKVEE